MPFIAPLSAATIRRLASWAADHGLHAAGCARYLIAHPAADATTFAGMYVQMVGRGHKAGAGQGKLGLCSDFAVMFAAMGRLISVRPNALARVGGGEAHPPRVLPE